MSKHCTTSTPPEKEFHAGSIKGSIWRIPASQAGTQYDQFKIRIEKTYKDRKDGGRKTTSYYQSYEMPHLVLVARKVHEYVYLREYSGPSGKTLADDAAE